MAGPREMIHQAITQDQRGTALMQSLRSSGGMPYQVKARCILQGTLFFTRATELGDYDTCKDGGNKILCLLCQQWRCRQVTCNHRRMSCYYALWMLWASDDYHWWSQQDGAPKARPTTQLFVLHVGFPLWLDRIELTMDTFMNNAPGHASRNVKSENRPHCTPCVFEVFEGTAWWEGWCGRGHRKEDYEHWWWLYTGISRVRACPCTKRGVQTTSMIPLCLRK